MTRGISTALALGLGLFGAGGALAETPEGATPIESAAASLPAEAATTAVAAANVDMSLATQELEPADASSDWEVAFTPYLWAAGINGEISIPRNDSEADIDQSFADIFGNLKFAFMGTLDVRYRRFIVHTDTVYLSMGVDVENVNSAIFTEGKADAKILVATGGIGYRVVDQGPMYVDVYAGGRLTSLDFDLELTGPLQTREASVSPSNISPLIGGRTRIPLGGRWGLALLGELGFDSDIKWQLAGSVQYDLGDHWRMGVGYRHLALHHDKDEAEFDLALSGPVIAFSYIF